LKINFLITWTFFILFAYCTSFLNALRINRSQWGLGLNLFFVVKGLQPSSHWLGQLNDKDFEYTI
jgi:hypothetical protein